MSFQFRNEHFLNLLRTLARNSRVQSGGFYKEMREVFHKVCGLEPFVFKNARSDVVEGTPCEQPHVDQWPFISAAICELGGFSNISKPAMIIRLQDLGLLVNKANIQLDWKTLCVDV
jgi:hypothetical protein